MKKITLVLFTLLTLLPLGAWADEVEIDGITYETSGTKATVITCADATTIIIPNEVSISETNYSITGIDKEAFKNCGKLQTLTINNPDLLENLDIDFVGSKVLTPLTIICKGIKYKHNGQWSGATNFFAVGDGNNGSGYDSATADENLTVLETVCGISVTTIADKAFNNNGGNKSIYLPKSITTISNISFSENKLSAFSIDNANAHFSVKDDVLFDKDGKKLISFPSQKANSYTIPNGVTTIGKDAFNNHQSLTSITIPASVETIEESAFNRAGANTELSVIFSGTSNLKSIDKSAFQQSGINSITLPNGITTIGDQAFQKCTKLTSINLPSSLTSIGGSAFNGCSTLSTINFAASYTALTIGSNAFYDCKLAEAITLTEGITTIGKNAFNHSSSFTSLLQNLKLPTTATFTDNIANEYTTVTRKVDINWNGSNWATYYSNMDLDLPTGLEAYTITNVDGTNIVTQALHYIHANEAVLLKRAEGASLPEYYGLPNSSTIDEDNGVSFNHNLFIGTAKGISNIATIPGDKYVLDGDKFVKAHQGSLPAFRCYLVLNNGDGAQPSTIYLTDTGNNTFIHLDEGNRVNYTLGSATLSDAGEKMKLTVSPGDNYYVTAENITIKRNTTANSARAMAIDDTTISFTADDANADPHGTTTYTFTPIANAVYEVTIDFQKRINIADGNNHTVSAKIKVGETVSDKYEFNGTKYEPEISEVVCDDVTLTNGKDFTVSYPTEEGANTNVSTTAKVIITGKGKYMNVSNKIFTITQRDISNVSAVIPEKTAPYTFTYTGSDIKPSLTITDVINSTDVIKESDYDITYQGANYIDVTNEAKITITGKGNYKGTRNISFAIEKKEMTAEDIKINSQPFTGSDVEPKPTIKYGDITLVEGTDYDITYNNNIYAGEATATFTFKGNYKGTFEKKFIILDHDQAIHVEFDNPDNQWTTYYYKENLALVDGLKAYVVTDINSGKVNIAEVNFIPKNTPVLLYSESGTKDFSLTTNYSATLPGDITPNGSLFKGSEDAQTVNTTADTKVFVLLNGQFVQTKGGEIAANRCYLVVSGDDATSMNVTTLDINKDMNAITILDNLDNVNTNIGTAVENTKGTLTVTPKNGYYVTADDITIIRNANTGSARAQQIDIDGGKMNVTAGDIVNNDDYSSTYTFTYDYNAAYQYQIVVKLQEATSFQSSKPTITFTNPTYNGLEQKAKPTVAYGENILKEGEDYVLIYPGDDYTKTGTGKKVTVYGIRKYCKDLSNNSFTINQRDISNIKPAAKDGQIWKDGNGLDTANPQVYFSGSAMELNFTDIVTYKDAENQDQELDLLANDNLSKEITVTYSNNTAVGTATATVKSKGVNNYKGAERTITFQILQKRLTTNDVTINDIPDQSYTGNEIAPVLTIKYNNVTLMEGADKDYTVAYSNNTNAGEATATITFLGNYSGSVTKTFKITEAEETVTINFDSANEWTTYYGSKNLSLTDELEAFVVTGIEGTKLTTASVEFIPQKTPVLLHRKSGTNTTFNVMTCSTESLDAPITPNSIFKGSLESTDISTADANNTKFILLNGQFVQATEGTLGAGRCYITLGTPPTGVNTLTIGKPSDGIIILEEGANPTQSSAIGSVTKATGNGKATLTVKANNGWYAEAKDITVVRSASANKGRAPQVDGNNVTLTSGEITTNKDYNTTYLFTYPYSSDYQYQVTVNFHKSTKLNEANPTITLNPTSYEYDNSEKKPAVTVKIGDVTLEENKDYVVSYENNVNKGIGKVNINGIRKYANGTYSEFNISQRDIKKVTVGAIEDQTFTGKAIEPSLTITDLVNEKDIITTDQYTIEYKQNINAGTATVTIIGKNNYTSSKSVNFTITPKTMTAENIANIDTQQYDAGKEIKPALSINYGDIPLTEGEETGDKKDYTVRYEDNTEAGTAKAIVNFYGNYSGTNVVKEFTIVDDGLPKKTVKVQFDSANEWTTFYSKETLNLEEFKDELEAFVVTGIEGKNVHIESAFSTSGKSFIPQNTPVLLHRKSGNSTDFEVKTCSGEKLPDAVSSSPLFIAATENKDISTITGKKFVLFNGKFVQTAEGTVAANRCYLVLESVPEGVQELTINRSVNDITVLDDLGNENKDIGTAIETPKGTLTIKPNRGYYVTADDITIVRNTNAGSARAQQIDVDDSKVKVTAGNIVNNADNTSTYTFTYEYNKAYQYQIIVKFQKSTELKKETTTITLNPNSYEYDKTVKQPQVTSVKVKIGDKDETLTKDVDYVVTYPADGNINAGKGKVFINGIRKYNNELNQEFDITKRVIANHVTLKAQDGQTWVKNHELGTGDAQVIFTGKDIEVDVVDIVKDAKNNETNIITTDDYNISYNNKNHKNASTTKAEVTISSKGSNYQGSKPFYFTILPKEMTGDDVKFKDNKEEYEYTGEAIEPEFIITYLDNEIVKGTDYDVAFENNVYAGNATAKVTFKGNYTGVVNKTFIIGDHGQTVSVNFENPDNKWTTYYYKENIALPTDGSLKAYVVTGYEGKEVQTQEVDFIPKNTPVLLYSESGETNFGLKTNYSATLTDVTPANIFKGTEEGVDIKTISGTTFVLVNGKFVLAAEGTLAANRCYLVISDEEAKNIGVSELTIKSSGNEIIYQQDGKANNSIGTASTSTPKDGKVILTVKPKKGYYINGTEDITVIKNAKAESARAQKIDDGKVTVNAGKITDNADHTSTYLFTYPYEQNCQYQITVNFHQATNITETGKQPTITFKDDVVYNGLEQKAEPEVVTYDGTKLTKNVDYVLSYPGDDYINAGTGKKVTVTGIRKYVNELSQNSFEIKPRNVSELTISGQEGQTWIEGHTPADATPQIVYTSKAIEVNVSDDIVIEGAKKSILSENDITVTYSNNLNAGTATVTIKNKQGGNYTGERVFNFEIVAMMMTADKIDAIPDQHYTGKAITPDITVKNGAITLVKGTDYEVDYSNNTDAGEATAIVNFKGNYAGENVKKTFKILEVEEEHTINFDNKNEWTTYYYDKNLSLPEEVEAFVVTGIEGATLNTAPVDFIPQNTPVLLRRMSGTNTTFSVKTCSTKRLDESTVPNTDLFKGSLEGIANIKTVDTDKAKFVLLNNEFVQTTEGALGANRCYLAVSTPAEGINTLTIGNPTMDIVILEDNATPQQANIIGKASKSTNGTTTTLTVTANNGWYVEANDITVVRSTNAEKGRAPQVGGENIKVNAGKRTDHEDYTTTYLFTYPYSSDYTYQVKVNFHKSTRLNEAKPTITLNPTSFEYDNSEKKPSVTVKIGDVTLKEKEDYVISYENNILPSTEVKGNVLINGIRKYATQVNKNFDINRRDINKAVIEGIEKTSLTYTGNEVEWKIKDLVKNENIIKEDDYTFTCSKEVIKDAGEYTITLEGSNNYQGKKKVTFTIQPKNLTGKAVIDPIEAINENGSPITPALTIKDGAITLNPETDYDVTYTNNVEDGKATATITFKGNYTGKAETNFTINHVAKDVPLNITFDKDNEWTTFFYTNNIIVPDGLKAYIIIGLNGKDITPKEVDFIPENVPVLLYREDKSKSDAFIGKTMPSDTKLSENIKPDSRFCGTLESIDIKTISGNKFVLLDNMFVQAVEGTLAANHCYINATISDVAELAIGKAIDARIYLEEGNPSTVGGIAETSTPDENGLITLTIKPNPNFYAEAKDIKVVSSASANDARAPQIDGSHVELTPVDETADPSGETQYTYKYSEGYHYQITVNFHKCVNFTNKETRPTVSITETSFVYNGTERKPIPTVIYNGVPLIENTDYAVIYQNNFNAGGASVVIKGKGHYSGEFIGATFNITKRSINSDNVKVEFKQNSFTYTGSPIKPEFTVTETITVGEETINIITTDDYEIAEWDNNTNASTSEKKAKLALHGIRNYDDFKDVYFEIQPKRLYKTNIKAIDNQEYTGSPIQPELTIMDGEYTLTSDDYDVKYSNNIYEGTAYVDVTFKGNYMGKVQTTFDILYRSLKREIDITFEGSNQWTTFYWNENLDIEGQGLTAYVVTGHEQGSTKLITEEVNFIPKNTGVLLYRTNTANAGPFYGMTMPTNTKLEGVTPDRNLFVGSMDSKDLADVKGVKFILVNDQFVQTTKGMLAAHRCYANFGDGKGIEGISNIETDKDLDAIIYKEEGEDRKAGSIGTVTLSEPQNGRKTLTVEPKPGFYAEPENITIIRSVDGTTARAAQVPSVEDKVVVTATNPSANPSKKTTYTFPYEEGYHYQIIVDFQKCADFTKGVTITLGNQTFEYDGNEKKPTVTAVYIKDNNGRNIKLKSNYYTISYANNINAGGAARVIVEGNWYYYGANGVNFNISQRDISKAKIEVNIPTQIYTGKPIEIDPKYIVVSDMVTINGKQKNIITENDYELVYSNNVEAGTAKVTIMPTKINYNGHGREYTFNIIMPIKGDANRDGLVNVTDIVEIVNYILGRPTSRFYFEGADVNEDGLVNVTDIVLVVNIILNGDNSVATREAIDEALADIWDEYVTAINNIKQEETVDVFDLKGRKVRANATDLKGLPQGVYIVRDKKMNTKKVFVK
ncbi:MAG: leucine-rich repeat protein [Prevotella sp.]|nr:leucine-rich repeat protein [Prevotella sp.]